MLLVCGAFWGDLLEFLRLNTRNYENAKKNINA